MFEGLKGILMHMDKVSRGKSGRDKACEIEKGVTHAGSGRIS